MISSKTVELSRQRNAALNQLNAAISNYQHAILIPEAAKVSVSESMKLTVNAAASIDYHKETIINLDEMIKANDSDVSHVKELEQALSKRNARITELESSVETLESNKNDWLDQVSIQPINETEVDILRSMQREGELLQKISALEGQVETLVNSNANACHLNNELERKIRTLTGKNEELTERVANLLAFNEVDEKIKAAAGKLNAIINHPERTKRTLFSRINLRKMGDA